MRSWGTVRRLVVVGVAFCTAVMARGQCVEDWRLGPESAVPGVNGEVYALAVHDDGRGPAVYIGGEFGVAGSARVRNIARWDGKTWEALGPGLNRPVHALASYNGELIAAGHEGFQMPGSTHAQTVVRYGPGGWAFFPQGDVNSPVNALLVHDGLLYVGGEFQTPVFPPIGHYFVGWNGSSWVRVTTDITPQISALTVWNGKVFAGANGRFAGGPRASENIAQLDGMMWTSLGTGTNRAVTALTVYNGELIAGGEFDTAGGTPAKYLARWDGVSWKPVGPGLGSTTGHVYALAVHDGQLFVGGDFRNGITGGESFLLRCDGSAWHSEMSFVYDGLGRAEAIYAMISMGDRLLVGGGFERLGSWVGFSLAAWKDEKFERVAGGLTYAVEQLYDDEGELLAMGQALDTTSGIARLDEDGAQPRWVGVSTADFNSTTRTVMRYGGRLVVGGSFTKVNGTTVNRIARQGELSGWEGMGAGFNASVLTLAEFRGELIAAGNFTASGPTLANHIARWDGAAWRPLGLGVNGNVEALAVHGDELIVGGIFTIAGGGPALNIAAWNGTSWRAMGAGLDVQVHTLGMFEGSLIAGGRFRSTEPGGLKGVARWNGTAWQAMGEGMVDWITALEVHQGRLIAGGGGLWRWDGMAWEQLTSVGRSGAPSYDPVVTVNSLISRGSELLVGGAFTSVSGEGPMDFRIATFFGRWGCAPCKADMDGDGVVDFTDYLTYLNLFDAQDAKADLNGDGIVDFPDYLEFLDAFSSGCA